MKNKFAYSEESATIKFILSMQSAWKKFVEKKNLPITESVITLTKARNGGYYFNLVDSTIPLETVGVFASACDEVAVQVFNSATIEVEEEDGKFQVSTEKPIWFTLSLAYRSKKGGTNCIGLDLDGNGNNDVWFNPETEEFLTRDTLETERMKKEEAGQHA